MIKYILYQIGLQIKARLFPETLFDFYKVITFQVIIIL